MGELNSQRPFAFNNRAVQEELRSLKKPRKVITGFSKNIRGICVYCGTPVQKIHKYDSKGNKLPYTFCKPCSKKRGINSIIKEFPKELLPWKILPKVKVVEHRGVVFQCSKCALRMFDWYVLGSICDHKTHRPPGGYVCRFCCTKETTTPPQPPVDIPNTRPVRAATFGRPQQQQVGAPLRWPDALRWPYTRQQPDGQYLVETVLDPNPPTLLTQVEFDLYEDDYENEFEPEFDPLELPAPRNPEEPF